MDIVSVLQNLGLDEKQALVYYDCLQYGGDTAFNISKRTKLKRPTVYVKVEELMKRGLIEKTETSKTTIYKASTPDRIVGELESRRKEAETLLPTLMSLYKSDPDKTRIQVLEGSAATKKVLEEALASMKDDQEVLRFGSTDILKQGSEPAHKAWAKNVKTSKRHVREILGGSPADREYSSNAMYKANPNHQIRVSKQVFENDNLIFGNKLAIFSIKNNLFVTVIEDEQIANSYRAFFNLAWQSAEELSR